MLVLAALALLISRFFSYRPQINPAEFSPEITHPYFRLSPGREFVYQGISEEGVYKIVIRIPGDTKEVMGVTTLIYHDQVFLNGILIEDTRDYLAQDKEGNVWYFGEDVDNYQDGQLQDHEGAWLAGEDGAQPGIWLKASPVIGDSYRQEYHRNVAEDMRDVVAVDQVVTTVLGTFDHCLQVLDWTPLDPESREHKYYCPAAGGLVLEIDLLSQETVELIGHN